MYGSTTENRRIFGLNGNDVSGTPAQDTLNGQFYLPTGSGSQDSIFAEFIVVRGTMTDSVRQQTEGYLAQKWGVDLDNSTPGQMETQTQMGG